MPTASVSKISRAIFVALLSVALIHALLRGGRAREDHETHLRDSYDQKTDNTPVGNDPGLALAKTGYSSPVYRREWLDLVVTLRDFCGPDNNSGFGDLPLKCMMDDLELELLYFSVREAKPEVVWEVSPAHGYSTTVILTALQNNNKGRLYSFDLMDSSKHNVPTKLQDRWELVIGDAFDVLLGSGGELLYPTPDYVLLDSVHSIEFGQFCVSKLLPALSRRHTYVALHDVYNPTLFGESCKEDVLCKHQPSVEGSVVTDWLGFSSISRACNAWTPSPFKLGNARLYSAILHSRQQNGIEAEDGVRRNVDGANPTIFFELGC